MCRWIQAAALAALGGLFAGPRALAQEPVQLVMQAAQTPKSEHVTEAVKETQAAIDAGNSGQSTLVVEHAQQALTHAEAAERERHSPRLQAAIRSLKEAVKQGRHGKVDGAKKAAEAALQKLQA